MMTEEFTAAAMCPECGAVDVWPWREPRKEPKGSDPTDVAWRKIGSVLEAITWCPYFDPDDAVVVRQCKCGHEWSQR